MKAELNHVIGLRVKRAREAAGLTQEKLAELIDRTKEAVSNIERGVNYPTIETLLRVSDAVNMPMSILLGETRGSLIYTDLRTNIEIKLSKMTERDLEFLSKFVDSMLEYKDTFPNR